MRVAAIAAVMCVLWSCLSIASEASGNSARFELHIARQSLDTALKDLATQTNFQVARFSDAARGDTLVGPITGQYSASQALEMLLAPSGLTYRSLNDHAFIVLSPAELDRLNSAKSTDNSTITLQSGDRTNAISLIALLTAAPGEVRADDGQATPATVDEPATAQSIAEERGNVQEVTVTGTRIVRDGYEAPTPVTVVGAEQLQDSGSLNVAEALENLPAFQGSDRLANGSAVISSLLAGSNALNLRGMGSNRTLVLFDGRRFPPAFTTGVVDTGLFPDALISRVDVVTGGASAAYGSDAVAGVVNYILNTNFTGIKGSLVGGRTTYGDRDTEKLSLAAGFTFASGRGHVLLSADQSYSAQLRGYERDWNTVGYVRIPNPQFTAGSSQPQLISRFNVGLADTYGGGIITGGPLKGTAFGAHGVPFKWDYGDPALLSSTYQVGGNWKEGNMQAIGSLSPSDPAKHAFAHAAFDITDNTQVFAEFLYGQEDTFTVCCYQYYHGNLTVHPDNPFMPAEVASAATSLGLTNIPFGKTVRDLPAFGADAFRKSVVYTAGAKGNVDLFDHKWKWNLYGERGESNIIGDAPQSNVSRFALAIDAVRAPNGNVVCRSTLTNPNNGCVPYNLFGTALQDRPTPIPGVNTDAALDYITGGGDPHVHQVLRRDTVSFDFSGEPFSLWAGPVSVAAGAEWRKDSVSVEPDALSAARQHYSTNFGLPFDASNNVKEAFVETVIPLAKEHAWAQALDFNAAARFTDYSTSGFVTTWKAGLTWSPINDLRFRATQSRDIRAPNLIELFAKPTTGRTAYSDPFLGNASFPAFTVTVGNADLKPEKADTTNLGIVYQPSFLRGFSTSIDYYRINIKGAIASLPAQSILDLCFAGDQANCALISRMPNGQLDSIVLEPANQNSQLVRGIDIEASYQTLLSHFVDTWDGSVGVRILATRTLENSTNTAILAIDRAGDNGSGIPLWSVTSIANYTNGPFRVTYTGRYISAGNVDNSYIGCTTDCPAVIPKGFTTIDVNRVASYYTSDVTLGYRFLERDTDNAEVFATVNNVFNRAPALITVTGNAYGPHTNANLYDVIGREFHVGIRFKF